MVTLLIVDSTSPWPSPVHDICPVHGGWLSPVHGGYLFPIHDTPKESQPEKTRAHLQKTKEKHALTEESCPQSDVYVSVQLPIAAIAVFAAIY